MLLLQIMWVRLTSAWPGVPETKAIDIRRDDDDDDNGLNNLSHLPGQPDGSRLKQKCREFSEFKPSLAKREYKPIISARNL